MGKVWIITGASRGLGLSLAKRVVESGDQVVLCARGKTALAGAVSDVRAAARGRDADVRALAGDVSDPTFAGRLVGETLRHFGRIDVLVNNASFLGPSPQPPLEAYPLDILEQVYRTNVLAPLRLIQAALPTMKATGSGLVINVTSDAAVGGYPGWGGYGSSKAALELITRTLAAELEGSGVRVVAVDPGDMRTRMHQEAFPGEDISDRPLPDVAVPAFLRIADRGPAPGVWRYEAQSFPGVADADGHAGGDGAGRGNRSAAVGGEVRAHS